MSLLRQIAVVLFVIGILGLFIPGIPGADFIRWSVLIAVIMFVVDVVTGNRNRI